MRKRKGCVQCTRIGVEVECYGFDLHRVECRENGLPEVLIEEDRFVLHEKQIRHLSERFENGSGAHRERLELRDAIFHLYPCSTNTCKRVC